MTETTQTCHYAVLGVPADATLDAVREAYKRLATRLHPDRHATPAAFRLISQAYETLSDAAHRERYDQLRASLIAQNEPRPPRIGDTLLGPKNDAAQRGRNRAYRLHVGFSDAMLGTPQEIQLPEEITCTACYGRGFDPSDRPMVCDGCGGAGTTASQSLLRTHVTPCGACGGRGHRFTMACTTCAASGTTRATKTFSVPLPTRAASGLVLRLRGAGEAGSHGGEHGDCLVTLTVTPHATFDVHDDDIVSVVDVPVTTALTGGAVEVDTIDGPKAVKLNPCSREGDVLRLVGHGAPRQSNPHERGDHRAKVRLRFPRTLDEHALGLVGELHAHLVSRGEFSDEDRGEKS